MTKQYQRTIYNQLKCDLSNNTEQAKSIKGTPVSGEIHFFKNAYEISQPIQVTLLNTLQNSVKQGLGIQRSNNLFISVFYRTILKLDSTCWGLMNYHYDSIARIKVIFMTKETVNPGWNVSLLNSSILSWNHKWFVYDPFSHAIFDVSPGLQWWFVTIALQIRGGPTLVRRSIETEASSKRMLSQNLGVSESATITDTSNNILRGC